MSVFRFKRFEVVNQLSAMKVNTDGVLLGAVMTINTQDRYLLDIGTGTGTIALMAAQRLDDILSGRDGNQKVKIDAIDIDEVSSREAADNFQNSPWSDFLRSRHFSLEEFEEYLKKDAEKPIKYDLIFSNPPYFDNSLNAPEARRNFARHTSSGLSYREIIDFASCRLAHAGRLAMILPIDVENDLMRYARMNGLHVFKITRIKTVPRKNPTRIIVEFTRCRPDSFEDTILVIQSDGSYTEEYLTLMKDFYLFA